MLAAIALGIALSSPVPTRGDAGEHLAQHLVGIHWWGYTPGKPIDTGPARLLGLPKRSAWVLESVLTHSADWWKPAHFRPLYAKASGWGAAFITRVDYTWDDPIPAPGDTQAATWPQSVADQAVGSLGDYSRVWVIGNEPNLMLPKSQWPKRQIPPEAYAETYRKVRAAIHQKRGRPGYDRVLIAGPSPGAFYAEVRWISGLEYLERVVKAIPKDEIDGFALHAYGWNAEEFAKGYREQLELLQKLGLGDKPVWLTEWNRQTQKPEEQANTARFIREAIEGVHRWNQTPGNLNIVGLCWFIYDGDQQAGGGWPAFSLEHWRSSGKPEGHAENLWSTYREMADRAYPAGVWGTRR